MKNAVLILMTLLIVGGGYFLKMKSDQVSSLSGALATRDATLKELQARLKSMDSRVARDESALADDQKRLSAQTAATAKLTADLAAAQQALAAEVANKKALQDQEASLSATRRDGSDPSLAGHIQNDQARLNEIDRQLKVIDASEKNRRATNKDDAKVYHEQMKVQEASLRDRIKGEESRGRDLQKQLAAKRKEKLNLDRNDQAAVIQQSIDASKALVAEMQNSLQQLRAKEVSDTQSNSYDQQQAVNYATDSRAALSHERTQVVADLANLKGRNGLVLRDNADLTAQLNRLRSQEHDFDVKIQSLNQTIVRLKSELAALPSQAGQPIHPGQ